MPLKLHGLHTKRCKKLTLVDIEEFITECKAIGWSSTLAARILALDLLCELKSGGRIAKVGRGVKHHEIRAVDTKFCTLPAPTHGASLQTGSAPKPTTPSDANQATRDRHSLGPSDHRPGKPAQCAARCSARTAVAGPSTTPSLATSNANGLDGLEHVELGSGRDGRTTLRPSYRRRAGPLQAMAILRLGKLTKRPSLSWIRHGERHGVESRDSSLGHSRMHGSAQLPSSTERIDRNPLPQAQVGRTAGGMLVNPNAFPPAPLPHPRSHMHTKVAHLPFLLKPPVMSMMVWPLLQNSITPNQVGSATIRRTPHIALALSTPTSLHVPTSSIPRPNPSFPLPQGS
ncbi:hypothetical protein BKA70DRAFT_1433534 [Coprinopsis sp. MPI-PUGE-AT-0042]|nr:hypothetical protein BKA70DRAFT_1433534 [Coprinopsis sp. MPI-PUGE-AT-0042]